MSVLKRIKRIVKTNVNEFLDRLEYSEDQLTNRIQELEKQAAGLRSEAAATAVSIGRLEGEETRLGERQIQLENDARKALADGPEDLARPLVEQRIDVEDQLQDVRENVGRLRTRYGQQKARLKRLRQQANTARTKRNELEARRRAEEVLNELDESEAAIRPEVESPAAEGEAKSPRERKVDELMDALKREIEND